MIGWQLTQLWNSWRKELERDSNQSYDLCDTSEMLYQMSSLRTEQA